MRLTKVVQKIVGVALMVAFLLAVLAGCSSGGAATPAGTATPVPPTPTATAGTPQVSTLTAQASGLGGFVFTLNSARTGISTTAITFNLFACGGITGVNGEIDVTNQNSWPITAGEFTYVISFSAPDPGVSITIKQGFTFSSQNGANLDRILITGRFDGAGTTASGTWEVNSACPGTWQSA